MAVVYEFLYQARVLDQAGKACHRQTLQLSTKIANYGQKYFITLAPVVNVIKHFCRDKKVRTFFLRQPLHPSLIFASRVGAYHRGALCGCYPLTQAPDVTCKFYTTLERCITYKCSSLFGLFVSNEEKSFMTLTPVVDFINILHVYLTVLTK